MPRFGTHLLGLVVLALGACDRTPSEQSKTLGPVTNFEHSSVLPPSASPPLPTGAARPASAVEIRQHDAEPTAPNHGASAIAAEKNERAEVAVDPDSKSSAWLLDDLVDVGPAGPAVATPRGVALVTRRDEVYVARLGALRPHRSGPSPVRPLEVAPEAFFPYARPPALVDDAIYWVSGNRLMRQALRGGSPDTLAEDARNGTRVAAATPMPPKGMPATVAYVAQVGTGDAAHLVAQLWVEGQPTTMLSPEGTSASTVALAPSSKGLMALYLEGRSGMSPLHARHIEFDGGGRPRFSPDVVAWVAGSTQPQTELAALGGSSDTWGLSALDRDATHFGLARIAITNPPKLSEVITWREYPNGLQPAPVATGKVCGNPVIAYVRPMTAEPHAPQELHLANLDKDGLGASTVLARGKAFSSVSLVGIPGGALVTWVADRRTWAVTLHCR